MSAKERTGVSLAGRLSVFLFIFSIFVLLLYVQGSYQDYLDDTLIKLLVLYKFLSLAYIVLAISNIVIILLSKYSTIKKRFLRIILISIGVIISVVFYGVVEIIITGLQPVK